MASTGAGGEGGRGGERRACRELWGGRGDAVEVRATNVTPRRPTGEGPETVRAGGGAVSGLVQGARASAQQCVSAPRGHLHPDPPGIGPDRQAVPRREPRARRLARRQLGHPREPSGRGAGGAEARRHQGRDASPDPGRGEEAPRAHRHGHAGRAPRPGALLGDALQVRAGERGPGDVAETLVAHHELAARPSRRTKGEIYSGSHGSAPPRSPEGAHQIARHVGGRREPAVTEHLCELGRQGQPQRENRGLPEGWPASLASVQVPKRQIQERVLKNVDEQCGGADGWNPDDASPVRMVLELAPGNDGQKNDQDPDEEEPVEEILRHGSQRVARIEALALMPGWSSREARRRFVRKASSWR